MAAPALTVCRGIRQNVCPSYTRIAAFDGAPAGGSIAEIDIGQTGFVIAGSNAGLVGSDLKYIHDFPFPGGGSFKVGRLTLPWVQMTGFGLGNLVWATGGSCATPRNFRQNSTIDGTARFSAGLWPAFLHKSGYWRSSSYVSPDFGPDSYMGFRTLKGNYGWLEVTWTAAFNEFKILAGAYEVRPGVPILAGRTGNAGSEPRA